MNRYRKVQRLLKTARVDVNKKKALQKIYQLDRWIEIGKGGRDSPFWLLLRRADVVEQIHSTFVSYQQEQEQKFVREHSKNGGDR